MNFDYEKIMHLEKVLGNLLKLLLSFHSSITEQNTEFTIVSLFDLINEIKLAISNLLGIGIALDPDS